MKKDYAIYVLDNYAVHLMPEIKKALFKKGYILVLIGGGVTGDIQIKDTHFHAPLKVIFQLIWLIDYLAYSLDSNEYAKTHLFYLLLRQIIES